MHTPFFITVTTVTVTDLYERGGIKELFDKFLIGILVVSYIICNFALANHKYSDEWR